MRGFFEKVSFILEEIIKKEFSLTIEHPLWEVSSNQGFGDFSSMAALKIASKLKNNPLDIAERIKKSLTKPLSGYTDKIEILGPGFVNIFLSKDTLINSLNELLRFQDKYFRSRENKKILIEFLSANPTGPLSIAHGRQAIVGDTIANVLDFFGNKVTREYYLNDAGRQIELFYDSVKAVIENEPVPEGGYKGEYIKNIADEYKKGKTKSDIGHFSTKAMLKVIKEDLEDLGIKFDNWFSQKKLIDKRKVEKTIWTFKKKGLIYDKDGALWFASTKFGDDKDRVIKKADGELTYFASDIAYHKDKIERRFGQLINLWGPDHHGYIKRVKTSMEALGYDEKILDVIIVQLVTLKTKQRMSKRAGTFILLSELIDEVGKDATRFYYLTRRNSSHLEFDIDLAKESSFDNTLYYVQYACARIESIFKKAKVISFDRKFSKFLKEPEELNLLRSLLQFTYCLEKARYMLEPVFIIEFLKNLAAGFHKFYEKVRVIDENEKVSQARLNLLKATRIVLHCALGLLGITPAEKM